MSLIPGTTPLPTYRALVAVARERHLQNEEWHRESGVWKVPALTKLSVLIEEVGEVGKAIFEREGKARLRAELIQVAAVAVAWAETLE